MRSVQGWMLSVLVAALLFAAFPLLPTWTRRCGPMARRVQSANNLKQVGLAVLGYHNQSGRLPTLTELDAEGRPLHSWQTRILPFVDNQALFDRIDFALPWDDPSNAPPLKERINAFTYPGEIRGPLTSGLWPSHYAGNVGLLGRRGVIRADAIPDGAATTILAGEALGNFRAWGDPGNLRDPTQGINKTPDGFGSRWTVGSGWNNRKGAYFVFADGSIRFLAEGTDPSILRALGTPDGGERIEDEPEK